MGRSKELKALTRMRFLLFMREPEAVFWVFMFPVIMAVVLGFAFREQEPASSRVLILPGQGAKELAATLDAAPSLDVKVADDEESAQRSLQRGRVDALMRVGSPPEFRFDSQREEGEMARLRVLNALSRPAESAPRLTEHRATEPGSRYVDFLLPGLLGMNLMGTGIWAVGFAVVDARQKKLLRRFLVTPMRRSSFLISFILSRLIFLCLEVGLLLIFALAVLGVPFRGNPLVFAFTALVGALCFCGLGLLLAARPQTIEGISGLMNVTMMPMWLCSGIFFSYERFPEALHPVLKLIPLTALNDALRRQMLEGASLSETLPEFAVIGAWTIGTFLLASRIFRWQ